MTQCFVAYYDSIGDPTTGYYMEKINLLLANRTVLETVTKVSKLLAEEKNFSISKFIEQTNAGKEDFNLQKKMETDIKKYDFQRKISFIRRKDTTAGGSEEISTDPIKVCISKMCSRLDTFDKMIAPEFHNDHEDLEKKIKDRLRSSMASILQNLSISNFDDPGSQMNTSARSSVFMPLLTMSPHSRSKSIADMIISESP